MSSFSRMAWVNRLHPEKVSAYVDLHAQVWPDVLERLSAANIRNYSIFLREPENLLFGYFEYHGTDYDADMERIAGDPRTREWWSLTDPCQHPLQSVGEGENWAPMTEVFHHE